MRTSLSVVSGTHKLKRFIQKKAAEMTLMAPQGKWIVSTQNGPHQQPGLYFRNLLSVGRIIQIILNYPAFMAEEFCVASQF